ncbi:MAG TPA: sulfite exporter TauE/SafE family protein [Gemmatimonadales bacterium]|nr:sulfite exporter TauE/SafE family protein [Gemmatimonadales bacterium]
MDPLLTLELLAIGAGAGGLGVLLGVGGGIVMVPALVLLVPLPFTQAAGTSLLCVVATSVAGSAVQFARNGIETDAALELQFFAAAGAVVAGLIAPWVPTRFLLFAFAALLLYTGWHTWPRPRDEERSRPRPGRLTMAVGGAVGAGVVATLLGVGGGVIFTPVLHLILGHGFHRAAATSVYIIGITAGTGAILYLARGDVSVAAAAPAVLGVLLGSTLASRLSHRIEAAWLKRAFVLLLLYVSLRMTLRGLSGG